MKKILSIEETELTKIIEEHFDCDCNVEILEDDDIRDVISLTYQTNEHTKILTNISEHFNISSSDIIVQVSEPDIITFFIDFIDLKTLLEELYETSLTGEYNIIDYDMIKSPVIEFTIK